MFHLRFALFALALLGIAPVAHATPCTAKAEVQRVDTLQDKLNALPSQDPTAEAAPAERQLVLALREALATAITHTLQCEAATLTDPAAIRTSLASRFGNDLTVQPAGMAGVIAVTAPLALGCDGDNILLLFRRQPDGWQPILDWRSDKYNGIEDSFGDFFGFIVTPGANSSPLIAVVHGMNSCTTHLGVFAVDLLAPATAQTPQRLLAHHDYFFYDRSDASPRLISRADGFTLRLNVIGVKTHVNYTGVFRYRTLADRLDRQPAANNARDFVDSWLNESWPVAAGWSAPPLEPLHAAWTRLTSDKGPLIGFGPVRACAQAGRFQVQLDLDDPPTASFYAKVLQGDGVFTLLALTPNPDPDCTGPDLMAKRGKP